ncbi:hypothetical protein K9U39_03370 [Rhodoblastus acidophilus]|uniref:DUF4189 domain-containing protein n=1 Tax=Candidatus Rhodoblastus alkanivorans TaxID=2954117 RepID=A0ABS9Z4T7_9HYPH|nr:hypothetical protein [Candidatus Rhodoblastus alkanivorans]MCI4677579.1 hypothetical protein [Candidatus Rhodoblastus alkanivorans]MCI4682689.1 hypothetical protein [Candidatus Rhodoblastus alkanivorans]MDI4639996.1 hypothetical protein [Rhodoblastus acidophilus]
MKFYEFEHVFLPRVLVPLLGGLFVICALQSVARAESGTLALGNDSFIVAADQGYGVSDCIRSGDDCAKIVADAWCEAHGHGEAKAYGRASDSITGAIRKVSAKPGATPRFAPDDVFIACNQ